MIPLLFPVLLTGCGQDPTVGTLSENVGSAFAPCSEAEIRFMADKHNFMTSFRPCGNNHFQDFSWSPDGRQLYFQLGASGHVMDAESPEKRTRPVPVSEPQGPGTWLDSSRLVVPVGPPADAEDDAPDRLAVVQLGDQGSVLFVDLPADLDDLQDLQRTRDAGQLLLTAVRSEDGPRRAWRLDTSDGTVQPAFEWLTDPVDRLSYSPAQDVVVIGRGDTVTLYEGATGTEQGTYTPAYRGALHPDGRWLMLEHTGEPVSIFYQRAWDELSEAARERELRRAKRFEEQLPENYPTEVEPPTFSFVDRTTGKRFKLTSVYGWDFQWYEPTDHYGSFLLWGFEGKQMKRNVLLGDFTFRLRAAETGRDFMGVEPWPEASTEPVPASSPGAADDDDEAPSDDD